VAAAQGAGWLQRNILNVFFHFYSKIYHFSKKGLFYILSFYSKIYQFSCKKSRFFGHFLFFLQKYTTLAGKSRFFGSILGGQI